MFKRIKNVKISGMSMVLPPKEISIYDELEYYGNNIKKAERARKMAGFYKRRIVDENTTAADLGIQAAENLIKSMKLNKNKIEAMVVVLQSPDYAGPCTSYSMHHRLGLSKDCYVTDLVQGCVGWCFGILTAFQMVSSGTFNSVLLITADTPSKGIRQDDRINAPLFGDAAVATLIEYDESAPETIFNLETYSEGFEAIIVPAVGKRMNLDIRNPQDVEILTKKITSKSGKVFCLADQYMDGLSVFEFATQKAPENIKNLMQHTQTKPEDYDLLCLHQANKQIVQAVGENAGFSLEKVPYVSFENYGNNTMNSVPSTILSFFGKNLASSNHKLLCSGYGNGLVVCSCILELNHLRCAEINDFKAEPDRLSNHQYIEYWQNKFSNL